MSSVSDPSDKIPQVTGIEGSQRQSVESEVLPPELRPDSGGNPLIAAMQGVAMMTPHKMGGDAMSRIVVGSANHFYEELKSCRVEVDRLRDRLRQSEGDFSNANTKWKVTRQQLASQRTTKLTSGALLTAGGVLFGAAVEGKFGAASNIVLGVSILLLVAGWLITLLKSNADDPDDDPV